MYIIFKNRINECEICTPGTEMCSGKCVYECDDESDPD